ncbi:hypothetical protein [Cellulomonas carbonis]|uniref:Pilus assembly protein PilO n=1 Tax=Cellulomonas carbonis T26 TaxID=947969 RepID=A0A0A0BNN7_9CELL|nr:hypothetical protein [Cellulomonas carbonis]KGM10113.1 hypothetical protein N868_16645 [Cellulomonas carbonis T26]GGB94113.1 hypothetical protein GCM10010972_03490 [Cellulomonas carbonis]
MAARNTGPKATGWVLGTVALVAAMGAGSWFLGIGPVLDEAAQAQAQAESVEQANDLQQIKIDRLAKQFEELPAMRAELASLQVQVPTDAQLSAYLRDLERIAAERSVTITAFQSEVGAALPAVVPVTPVAPPAEAATTDATAAAESGTTGEAASEQAPATTEPAPAPTTAEPVPVPAPPGFVAIPVGFSALGSYENVVAFLDAAQTGTSRLFLVASFVGQAQTEVAESGGRPATVPGDLEMAIAGYVYVLQDTTTPAAAPGEGEAAPTPLPGAVPGKNPLIPVGGTAG